MHLIVFLLLHPLEEGKANPAQRHRFAIQSSELAQYRLQIVQQFGLTKLVHGPLFVDQLYNKATIWKRLILRWGKIPPR